jgi:aspartate aminotransferase-like enzyme|tara:strand:- start:531 stop:929 length:399 start_codon:yes stop_codon:yes gene_type:complete
MNITLPLASNTLPFTSVLGLQRCLKRLHAEIHSLKERNQRLRKTFHSLIEKIEEDLCITKNNEMLEYERELNWLVTNVLKEEVKRKEESDQYLREQEMNMKKAYEELYYNYDLECSAYKERILELEKKLKKK